LIIPEDRDCCLLHSCQTCYASLPASVQQKRKALPEGKDGEGGHLLPFSDTFMALCLIQYAKI